VGEGAKWERAKRERGAKWDRGVHITPCMTSHGCLAATDGASISDRTLHLCGKEEAPNSGIKKKPHTEETRRRKATKHLNKASLRAWSVPLLRALLHVYGACGVRRTLHGGMAACDGGRACGSGSGSGRHILVDWIAVRVVEEPVGRVLGDKDISACRTTTCSMQPRSIQHATAHCGTQARTASHPVARRAAATAD
jgi:hypothetical protein